MPAHTQAGGEHPLDGIVGRLLVSFFDDRCGESHGAAQISACAVINRHGQTPGASNFQLNRQPFPHAIDGKHTGIDLASEGLGVVD